MLAAFLNEVVCKMFGGRSKWLAAKNQGTVLNIMMWKSLVILLSKIKFLCHLGFLPLLRYTQIAVSLVTAEGSWSNSEESPENSLPATSFRSLTQSSCHRSGKERAWPISSFIFHCRSVYDVVFPKLAASFIYPECHNTAKKDYRMCLKDQEGDKSPELWPNSFSHYSSACPDLLGIYHICTRRRKKVQHFQTAFPLLEEKLQISPKPHFMGGRKKREAGYFLRKLLPLNYHWNQS